MNLSYDIVGNIYSYINNKEVHKINFTDTLFELDKQKKPMCEFKEYFLEKYKESLEENISFFSLKFLIWEIPEKRWRNATVNKTSLFGDYLQDNYPPHLVVHVCPNENWKAYDWEYPNETWWKPIN